MCRPVRKIRSACRQPTELLHHDRPDVRAFSGHQRAARVLRIDHLPESHVRGGRCLAGDPKQRQRRVRFRHRVVGSTNVHPARYSRAVAGPARGGPWGKSPAKEDIPAARHGGTELQLGIEFPGTTCRKPHIKRQGRCQRPGYTTPKIGRTECRWPVLLSK